MREECYECGAPKTSSEHVPPECFFPDGYNSGLLTVPSCDDHNSKLSLDVEYTRNIICGQHGVNLVGIRACDVAKASFSRSEKLFQRTFSRIQTIEYEGEETGAYQIELPRLKRVMKAVAFALYYIDFGERHTGDFYIFAASLQSRSNLCLGQPDGYERVRAVLSGSSFRSMPVPQPKVFKYAMLGEGNQVHYRFEFYETFVVYAMMLPYKLNSLIYVPLTRDCLAFGLQLD